MEWSRPAEVELLFQTKTIADVRQVEGRVRQEIEEKKHQLRQVVGDSYRDLIASADTIIGIHQQCQHVVELVGGLEACLASVSADVAQRRGSGQDTAATSSYDKLFALGSRIKYLIDTPETIYGCLDAREFLEAAQRYVRAGEVHRALTAGHRHAAQRFPLLRHQWPLVKKLGSEAWDRAIEWLSSQGCAPEAPEQVAGALAALALLRSVDGAEVLKHYLAARQRHLLGRLSAASRAEGGTPTPDAVAAALADLVAQVCATVAQCGELFLSRPGLSSDSLLQRTAAARGMAASELLFDAGSSAGGLSREAAAWLSLQKESCERLASLSSAGVALECSQWLQSLATQASPLCAALLTGCSSGGDLLGVESGARQALQEWQYTLKSRQQAGTEAPADGAATSEVLSWSDACQWVCGRPAPLWTLLLEAPLLGRAKELVARDFAAVPARAGELLTAALVAAKGLPPSAPGAFDPGNWSEALVLQLPAPGDAASALPSTSRRSRLAVAGGGGEGASGARGWVPRAQAVLQAIDSQMDSALDAALDSTQAAAQSPAALPRHYAPAPSQAQAAAAQRAAALADAATGRAAVLEPYVQERCSEAVEAVAALLDGALGELAPPQGGDAVYAATAHAALVLGRVAVGVADRSAPLRLVLGPPAQWREARAAAAGNPLARRHSGFGAAGRAAAAAAAAAAAPGPRLDALQQRLRAVSAKSYGLWAAWASRGVAERLVQELAADRAVAADAALRGWEESSVAGPDSGGEEVRFWLPAAPSPAAMSAALGGCAEVDRAGGHQLEDPGLAQLRWGAAGEVASALQAAVEAGGPLAEGAAVSEKGVLQLIFDVRLLASLLLAGPPPPGSPPAAATTLKQRFAALEAHLSGRLDPIDWATYEAHLYANVARFAGRSRVLLGALGRDGASRADTPAAAPSSAQPADANMLRMAPAGPRFSYLPVNTPSVLRQRSMQQGDLAAAGFLGTGLSAAAAQDPSAQYSFASLSTGRGAARRAAAGEAADAGASAAGVGAAALEALRHSRFGSLLGDKAMEVSASFGDYSFSNLQSSGAGLLSSLTTFKK